MSSASTVQALMGYAEHKPDCALWVTSTPSGEIRFNCPRMVHTVSGYENTARRCTCGLSELEAALHASPQQEQAAEVGKEMAEARLRGLTDFFTGQPSDMPYREPGAYAKESQLNAAWCMGYDSGADMPVFVEMVRRADKNAKRADLLAAQLSASPVEPEQEQALRAIQSQCAGHADEFSQRVWVIADKALNRQPSSVAPPVQGEWQPIETAPKDGTHMLVFFPTIGIWQVLWSYDAFDDGFWSVSDNKNEDRPLRGWSDEPTHWMPLPNPPAESQTQEPS